MGVNYGGGLLESLPVRSRRASALVRVDVYRFGSAEGPRARGGRCYFATPAAETSTGSPDTWHTSLAASSSVALEGRRWERLDLAGTG